MAYLNSDDNCNSVYESIIWDVLFAYSCDITGGCQLYYTPDAMNPSGSLPRRWKFDALIEVKIAGVDQYYEGGFYKYR